MRDFGVELFQLLNILKILVFLLRVGVDGIYNTLIKVVENFKEFWFFGDCNFEGVKRNFICFFRIEFSKNIFQEHVKFAVLLEIY